MMSDGKLEAELAGGINDTKFMFVFLGNHLYRLTCCDTTGDFVLEKSQQ